MNKIVHLKNMGFKVPWKLISIGLFGEDKIPTILTHTEIIEYLDGLLEGINEQTDKIIALVCEKDDYDKFDKVLLKYASEDDASVAIQKRKWRVFLLNEIICNVNKDCLQGMMELMEFWISMGQPDDCPQDFPSSGDKKAIHRYFTQESYLDNLKKNREWLRKEISAIVKLESL